MKHMMVFSVILLTTFLAWVTYASYTKKDTTPPAPIVLDTYRHYKGGEYKVICLARLCDDPHQQVVIYEQLHDSVLQPDGTPLPKGTIWARSKEAFTELTEHEGKMIPRFERIK